MIKAISHKDLVNWLIKGDVSIQYQVYRDLLMEDREDLRQRIALEGWGYKYLSKRNPEGHWGKMYYQPKWTSSHYTLLDLRSLCISPDNHLIRESLEKIVNMEKGDDGGINPHRSTIPSDVCVCGMFLNFASYFKLKAKSLQSIVDFLLGEHMSDGGFNCRSNRNGARHSSLHSTLSVLEGIEEYYKNGYSYRLKELLTAKAQSIEFILMHQLYKSDRTGKIINKDFLRLSFPGRWRYDILRALDFFQYAEYPFDNRVQAALDIVLKKRNKDGTWNLQAKIPGQTHFDMEIAGKPSRWNTLRAMRVLKHFKMDYYK